MDSRGEYLSLNHYVNENVVLSAGGGNVGVGLTGPTERLDVNGQIRIRGGAPSADRVLRSDANGVATWADPNTLVDGDDLGNHAATQNLDMNADWVVDARGFSATNTSNYDKLRVWNSSSYTIGMASGQS